MKKKIYPIWIALVLIGLFIFSIVTYWLQARYDADDIMIEHIAQIAQKIEEINKDCTILSFEHDHNFVDFLNVIKFYGSEVGPLNLANPQNWQGPYLKDNPTMQEKYYQIVRTKYGYFVVPGSGVKLSNGLVIGQDIIFNNDTDINQFITQGRLITKQGKPLAQQILKESNILIRPVLTEI